MKKAGKSSQGAGKRKPKGKPEPIFCEVLSTPAFKRAAKKLKLTEEGKADLVARMKAVGESFGKMHLHTGLGIRDLGGGVYECRSGLDLRLVFVKDPDTKPPTLYFDMVGNHDTVRKYLKRK